VVFTFRAARARGATVVAKTRACANIGRRLGVCENGVRARTVAHRTPIARALERERRPSNPAIESRGIRSPRDVDDVGATYVFERCHRLCVCYTFYVTPCVSSMYCTIYGVLWCIVCDEGTVVDIYR